MKHYLVTNSNMNGQASIPSSKSQSIRAILFATMANGESLIRHYLDSPDIHAMIAACRQLGATIDVSSTQLNVIGTNAKLKTPDNVIDCGNSGQVLRFVAALAGFISDYIVLTGDHSIRHNRPVLPVIESLRQLGMQCNTLRNDDFAPLIINGPFQHNETQLSGEDSQPVSALLMALPFNSNDSIIHVRNPGEKPWIDLTLKWLDKFNIYYTNDHYEKYEIKGKHSIQGFNYTVPGDLSSLAYPLVAALITQSEITIHGVDLNEPQGDKAILDVVKKMGAKISINEKQQSVTVYKTITLSGIDININNFIDCITIIAVLGCYATGTTTITGAEIARKKESDRITVIATELKKMGAQITEQPDGLIIKQSTLSGATIDSHNDHRIAMSVAVAALAASGQTVIKNVACVNKSFPHFAALMQALGANINVTETPSPPTRQLKIS